MKVTPSALARTVGALACAVNIAVEASEGGGGNYAIGAQTVAAAYLPPPGATEFYGYLVYDHAGSFRDAAGNPSIPQFDAQLVAGAPRVVHTWGEFHEVSLSSGGFAEATYVKVAGAGHSDHSAGIDLLGLEPLTFTAGIGSYRFLLGPVIYIPAGEYHRDAPANCSTHYASAAIETGLTWTPTPRWDLSLNPDVTFNMRNKATGYRSGTMIGLTGGASWRPFVGDLRWQVGVSGYYEQQITDDREQGSPVPGGFRLRRQAIGPQIGFWPQPASAWLLKWQHEFDVRNGTQGELVWIEFAFPF
jgi:hypothetical protein